MARKLSDPMSLPVGSTLVCSGLVNPRPLLTATLLAFLAAGCAQVGSPAAAPVVGRAPDVPMVLESFDNAQLSAAIFDETNRVRLAHGHKALKPDSGLDAAADEQATYTALALRAGHDNPMPAGKNVAERVAHQNVPVAYVGENSIMMGAVRPEGSNPYYGYREFAAMLVDGWMNSPEHRENMLRDRFTELGCAARLSHAFRQGDFRIFAIQVFARPPGQGVPGEVRP
jgi:uncharacterized protein YkwD